MTERPNYYAIIPAVVRYDDDLPPNAKLLYGEITALTNQMGFCYASNAYFCELYGFSDPTISRLLKALEDGGFIKREIERDSTGQVSARKIWLTPSAYSVQPPLNFEGTSYQSCGDPPLKIDGENITVEYTLSKKGKGKRDGPDLLSTEQMQALLKEKSENLAVLLSFGPDERQAIFDLLAKWYGPRTIGSGKPPLHTALSVSRLCSRLEKGKRFDVISEALLEAMSRGWTSIPDRLLVIDQKKQRQTPGKTAPASSEGMGELM